jgi:hypothetical protein
MLFYQVRPDNDIVQIYMTKLAEEWAQGSRHMMLMDGWCVPEAHGHYEPLIEPERRCHSCQVNVIWMDPRLKERVGHIELTPNFSFRAVGQNVVYSQ